MVKHLRLVIAVLVFSWAICASYAQNWVVTTEFTDNTCSMARGRFVTKSDSCSPVSTCTATGHGSFYQTSCYDPDSFDPTLKPPPAGWAKLSVWNVAGGVCTDTPNSAFVAPPNHCIFTGTSTFAKITADCSAGDTILVNLYGDFACTMPILITSPVPRNVCVAYGEDSMFGVCAEDLFPAVEPVAVPVAEPVAVPVAEPVAEPVAVPVAVPVAEPVATPASEPVAEPMAGTPVEVPLASPVAEPMADTPVEVPMVQEPMAEPAADSPEVAEPHGGPSDNDAPESDTPESSTPEDSLNTISSATVIGANVVLSIIACAL